jgi:hypothetical protein
MKIKYQGGGYYEWPTINCWLSEDQWNRIDQAIHDEVDNARVTSKFLPKYAGTLQPDTWVVPAEKVDTAKNMVDNEKLYR